MMIVHRFTFLLKPAEHQFCLFKVTTGMKLVLAFLFLSGILNGQIYISKDNYTGNWEASTTWTPAWTKPDTVISGLDVTVNGYVSRNGSLTFTGTTDYLRVSDTLVIYGNLTIKNNSKLVLNNNSVLIVRGNLTLGNTADIYSNSYLVVTGDFIKTGDVTKGSFYTDIPSNVFILGNVPNNLDPYRYPVLQCPSSHPYFNSGCGYGNDQDLAASPINSFFKSTCPPVDFTSSSSPLCVNESRTLTATPAGGYFSIVTGDASLIGNILKATTPGTLVVKYSKPGGCNASGTQNLVVHPLPTSVLTVSDNSGAVFNDGIVCAGDAVILSASGGTSYSWSSGETTPSISKTTAGTYTVTVTDANQCRSTAGKTVVVNALPVAALSVTENSGVLPGDGILCSGSSALISASGGISYSWSGGETSSSITTTVAGMYRVTATDVNNCRNDATAVISVTPLPVVSVAIAENSGTAEHDGILCSGSEAVLTASGAANYLWSTGETTPMITKNTSGTYTVTATDGNGCQNTGSATLTVNALPSPTVIVTENSGKMANDGVLCSGESAILTASGGIHYAWSTGETTPAVTATRGGTYVVTVTDENRCQNQANASITVKALPAAAISILESSGLQANDGILCNGASAKLEATGGNTFAWSTGETSPEIITSSPGTFAVIVTDGNFCQSSANATITVNPLPTATITVSENSGLTPGDGIICNGSTVTISVSGGTNCIWSTGETSSSVKTSSPGTYLVTVTDGNDCQSKASTVIETRPLPVADILIAESSGQFSDDGVICQGDSAILFVRGQDTYQWSTGEKGPQIRVKEAGTYNLTATSSSGCVSTANASVSTVKVVADAGKDVDVCGLQHTLTATSLHGTGRWSIRQGPGLLTFVPDENDPDAIIKTNTYGTYKLIWMVMKENCRASSDVRITFHELPVANAGPDQDLNYAFQTKLEAEVTSPGNGRWSLLSGSGNLSDPRSPVADVFNLAKGKNQFLWTISSDMCSAADTVSVMVNDLFVPNVITPDGDNKNQYFVIRDIEKNGPAELTVFNKWGKTVYRNNNYNDTWDGRSSENALLPDDTYFYVLKMADGKIIRSFLVIKR